MRASKKAQPENQRLYRSLLPLALKRGITTYEEGAALRQEIEDAESDGRHVVVSSMLLAAWKRRAGPAPYPQRL